MTALSWLNGQLVEALPLADRAIHYGDGHFTTIAVRHGQMIAWPWHQARLQHACQRLAIPFNEWSALALQIQALLVELDNAVIKIIISRGAGPRGYYASSALPANLLVQLSDWPQPDPSQRESVIVRLAHYRLSENPVLAGLKHLNRLEQVLARQEWQHEFDEALVFSQSEQLIEAVSANVFLYHGGEWLTPQLDRCGVNGVMRQVILEALPRWGERVQSSQLYLSDLHAAEEVFLTNSLIGIWPVRAIEQQRYPCQRGAMLKAKLAQELNWG